MRSQARDVDVGLDQLFKASVQFQDHRLWAAQIRNSLSSSLHATGSMAGADDHGQKFGKQYDPAANAVLDALGRTAQGLGQIGFGLLGMYTNYLRADAASDVFNPNVPVPALTDDCEEQVISIPSAIGESGRSSIPVFDQYWPQGDTNRLREAAAAWTIAASAIGNLKAAADQSARLVTAYNDGQGFDAFAAYWGKFSGSLAGGQGATPLLDHLQAACTRMARACSWQADQIDHLRDGIRNLAVAAGVATVAGVALTIFTIGLSDAGTVVVDGALTADAAVLVVDFAAAEAASVEIAGLADVAELEQVAAAVPFVLPIAANVTNVTAPLSADTSFQVPMGVPQAVPPLPEPGFELLSPADFAAAAAWKASLVPGPIRGSKPGSPAYEYQARVVGTTEYHVPGRNGFVWADGVRAEDGALVDAKYVGKPDKTCFSKDNGNARPQTIYDFIYGDEANEMSKYAGALEDPNNKARFLDIVTNDPIAVPYFEALMLKYGIRGRVRLVP